MGPTGPTCEFACNVRVVPVGMLGINKLRVLSTRPFYIVFLAPIVTGKCIENFEKRWMSNDNSTLVSKKLFLNDLISACYRLPRHTKEVKYHKRKHLLLVYHVLHSTQNKSSVKNLHHTRCTKRFPLTNGVRITNMFLTRVTGLPDLTTKAGRTKVTSSLHSDEFTTALLSR